MILTMVWDGLRPDMITQERTPHLWRRTRQGVMCRHSHCVFPTATRINSASLATGCYPARHGIVDNELYIPSVNAQQVTSCADWRALQRMADEEGGRLLTTPTLGEVLRERGFSMASAGSGSPGTTYLTNPTVTGPIVNWALSWGDEIADQLAGVGLNPLDETSTSTERNRYVIEAIEQVILPQYKPDALTVWFTEPDHAQHAEGLATPEVLAMLRELDADVERLVESVEAFCGAGNLTCFVISDHGFSTVTANVDPTAPFELAGFRVSTPTGPAREDAEVFWSSNSLFLRRCARERVGELTELLLAQPWVSGVFARDDLCDQCPGAIPQSEVGGDHSRSAEIMFSYRWSDDANEAGVPGSVVHPAPIAGIHGSSSRWTLNNTLVGWGAGLKAGAVSEVPCGIVDIAPTILHLLGQTAPEAMQGRVLSELLVDGPAPDVVSVTHDEKVVPTGTGGRSQVARYSVAAGKRYLDQVQIEAE